MKDSFFVPADSNRTQLRGYVQRHLTWLVWTLYLAIQTASTNAQTVPNTTETVREVDGTPMQRVDVILPPSAPLDQVTNVDASVSGVPIGKEKVKFTPTTKIKDYECAVLFLVYKSLGNKEVNASVRAKLFSSVRETLKKFVPAAEQPLYKIGIASFADGNLEILASIGSKSNIINSAITEKYLNFNGSSAELYRGVQLALDHFKGLSSERKFLVVMSDGTSDDKITTQADVIEEAAREHVHICTIGYPKSTDPGSVQRLEPLSDATGGYAIRTVGTEFRLPLGFDDPLLKYMVSGGRAEINLGGLSIPLDLNLNVQTDFKKNYAYVIHAIIPPGMNPSVTPFPFTSATPNPSMIPQSPSSPPIVQPASTWNTMKERLVSHPIISAMIAVLLVIFAMILFALLKKKPQKTLNNTPSGRGNQIQVIPPTIVNPPSSERVLAWLIATADGNKRYPISKSAVRIGRKPDNEIIVTNDSVSNHHAEILKRGDKFIIADLDASNGVYVGGKRVEKTALEDGDVIELGDVQLRFVLNSDNG